VFDFILFFPQLVQSTVVVVDIDRGLVEIPEDLPPFPDRTELLTELDAILQRLGVFIFNPTLTKK
jgi:hypothetical protein